MDVTAKTDQLVDLLEALKEAFAAAYGTTTLDLRRFSGVVDAAYRTAVDLSIDLHRATEAE